MKLTSKNAKTLPVGIYRLDRGIYLRVTDTSRFWILKIQKDGKRTEYGLGGVNQPIESVRNTAAKIKAALLEGKTPVKNEPEPEKEDPFFKDYSIVALDKAYQLRQWAETTKALYHRCNRAHFIPKLGTKRMSQITLEDLIATLTPIWTNASTAFSLSTILGYIVKFAYTEGYSSISADDLTKAIQTRLPSARALRKASPVKHFEALSPEDLREAVHLLRTKETISLKCTLFGILTVGRVSEYCNAKWSEIDLKKGIFTLPSERRKDRKPDPFLIPLSKQAVDLLRSLPQEGEYVFSARKNKPLVKESLLDQYQKMLGKKITLHGCRSSFSDWCAKNNKNFLVSEKCLMHSIGNAVFMAYQRDDLLDQRRVLLQEWADYLFS